MRKMQTVYYFKKLIAEEENQVKESISVTVSNLLKTYYLCQCY